MTSFMLLYNGPATTRDASHEGWPEWFQSLGDRLVDRGSPMTAGIVVAAEPPLSVHSVGVHLPDTFAPPRKRDTSERLPECRPSRKGDS